MKELIKKILREQEEEEYYPIPIWGSKKKHIQIYDYLDKIIKKIDGVDNSVMFKDERYNGHWFVVGYKSKNLTFTVDIFYDICQNAGKPLSLTKEEVGCDIDTISQIVKEWIKDRYNITVTGDITVL